jgi:hypothetical protein
LARLVRICTSPGKTTARACHITLHDNIPQTQPQPTHTALQQSQRTTEMTMTVGRRRHGVVVAVPGCQGRPSTSPCCRCRRSARRRVYLRLPERRPRHCGGRDGGAGAMGPPPDEGGAGGSGTRRVGPGGRPRRMPVHADSAMGDREGGEDATAGGGGGKGGGLTNEPRGGGRRTRRGGGDAVVGGVALAVDDNGEDDDGIRRHQATTNPVMATMAAVADDDGDGGRRRR